MRSCNRSDHGKANWHTKVPLLIFNGHPKTTSRTRVNQPESISKQSLSPVVHCGKRAMGARDCGYAASGCCRPLSSKVEGGGARVRFTSHLSFLQSPLALQPATLPRSGVHMEHKPGQSCDFCGLALFLNSPLWYTCLWMWACVLGLSVPGVSSASRANSSGAAFF